MSYSRWGEGDIYAFDSCNGGPTCMECLLLDEGEDGWRGDYIASRADMLAHFQHHRNAGHNVPDRAFEQISYELDREAAGLDPYDDDGAVIRWVQAKGGRR